MIKKKKKSLLVAYFSSLTTWYESLPGDTVQQTSATYQTETTVDGCLVNTH